MKKWLGFAGLLALLSACSSDGDDGDASQKGASKGSLDDCYAIIDACHEKDDGSNQSVSMCHEGAHNAELRADKNYTLCTNTRERCVAECEALPDIGGHGGSHSQGGAHSHGGTGGEHTHGGVGGAAGHHH